MITLLFVVEGSKSSFLGEISIVNRRICVFREGKMRLIIGKHVILNQQVLHVAAINR